jgi:hypothetical protein
LSFLIPRRVQWLVNHANLGIKQAFCGELLSRESDV